MTTKKIVIIVVSVVVGLGLLFAILIGGIVGFTFYSIGKSEAATTAKDYLRENEQLKQDIGEIKEFGSFVTGNVNITNNDGTSTINLKVVGERKTVNASVDLIYRNGQPWRVIGATYKNEAGETVDLLNPYNSQNYIRKLAA